jgi:hypothetical protein
MKMRSVQRGVAKKPVRQRLDTESVVACLRHLGTETELHKANILSLSSQLQDLERVQARDGMSEWVEIRRLTDAVEPLLRGFRGRMRWLLTGK